MTEQEPTKTKKSKGRPRLNPDSKRVSITLSLDNALLEKIRSIATAKEISTSQYVNLCLKDSTESVILDAKYRAETNPPDIGTPHSSCCDDAEPESNFVGSPTDNDNS